MSAECVRSPRTNFFVDLFETACVADELLVEISLPAVAPGTGWAFREMARRHGDYALVGVAVQIRLDSSGRRCQAARVTLFSVGPGPVFATKACASLVGASGSTAEIEVAARLAAYEDIDPSGDIHATPAYRRHLAEVLTTQALEEAFARATTSAS